VDAYATAAAAMGNAAREWVRELDGIAAFAVPAAAAPWWSSGWAAVGSVPVAA
jgi:thiamine biosynthesis lipoprotein